MWGVAWAREHQEQIGKQALRAGVDWVNSAFQAVSSVGFMAFGAFLTAFFFYFTCSGYGRVRSFWEGLIPERRKTKAIEMLQQMDRVIAGFIRGRLTICGCLIVYYTLAYWLIGVPGFVILGPVVGALSLLPYMSGLGAPVAMLLVWLDPSAAMVDVWWWIIGAPIGVSMIAQGLDDYVLTPAIQGKETGMDMPTILFASLAGGAIAGVYGLLIAIPAAACIKIVIREIVWPRFRAWATGKASDFLPIEEK